MSMSISEAEVPLLKRPLVLKRNEIFVTAIVVVPLSSEISLSAKLNNDVHREYVYPFQLI